MLFEKSLIVVVFSMVLVGGSAMGNESENEYFTWDAFSANFGKQMASSEDVFNSMFKRGLRDFSMLKFDFHFVSNKKENLEKLAAFLGQSYPYSLETVFQRDDGLWELTGLTNEFPVTSDNLLYWALDMYKRGYEFDSEFDGYGAPLDPKEQTFPDFDATKESFYFDAGVEHYNANNLSGALINWTNVIKINNKDPNAYYSRAVVKNELYTWKSALRDYDKAIEIAPNFIDAILNRGSVKDENGDYEGAISDYNLVLKADNLDDDNRQKAHFNRGNTYFNINQENKACEDWRKAREFGAEYADERISKYCTQ